VAGRPAGKPRQGGASKVTPPRLAPVRLEGLRDDDAPDFRRAERYDGMRYSRAAADGLELSGITFAECEFAGVSFNEAQLRGATFRDCVVEEAFAPVLNAARSTMHDVVFNNPGGGRRSSTRAAGSRCGSTAARSTT
jgi:uncharacterized protein YjbI with pentapeptide repeats